MMDYIKLGFEGSWEWVAGRSFSLGFLKGIGYWCIDEATLDQMVKLSLLISYGIAGVVE